MRRTILEKAVYTPFDHGHLALKLERYVHGTSPIRRYGDILIQRAIHRICRTPDIPENAKQLTDDIEDHARLMNYGELKSRNAQHDYERFHTIEALARNPTPRANIHYIDDMHVQLLLPRLGLKKSINHSALPHGWRVANDRRALIFQENVYIRPGTSVLLRIGDVFPSRAEWTIDSMEPKWNGGERLPERFQQRLSA